LIPFAIVGRMESSVSVSAVVDLVLFTCATTSLFLFYGVAIAKSGGGLRWKRWLEMPMVMAAAIGLSISQTRAVLEGLFGNVGVFERTPKTGTGSTGRYRSAIHWLVWLELCFAAYLWIAFVYVAIEGWYLSLPFLALFALGYSMMGLKSVQEAYSTRRVRRLWPVSAAIDSSAGHHTVNHNHQGTLHSPDSGEKPRRTA